MNITSPEQSLPPSKRCRICGEDKPRSDFSKHARTTDRLNSYCKACSNERNRLRYIANKASIDARHMEYYWKNKETYYARGKKWAKAHPEKIRVKYARWYYSHQDERRESSARWYSANGKRARVYGVRWRAANPARTQAQGQKRRARVRGAEGSYTFQEWLELKAQYDYRCLCCGKQEPEIKLTVDHVIPLSKGGRNDIANIQPLCKSCNSSKNTKHIDYRSQYSSFSFSSFFGSVM